MKTIFKANDGKIFDTKEACEKYEAKLTACDAAKAAKKAKIKKYKDEIAKYRDQYEDSILKGQNIAREFEKEFPKEYEAYRKEMLGDVTDIETLLQELIAEL